MNRSTVSKAMEKFFRGFSCPAWLFGVLTLGYNGLILRLWSGASFHPQAAAAPLLLDLAFGFVLAFLANLPAAPRNQKGLMLALTLPVTLLHLTEYFLLDAYHNFMPLRTVLAGAGGVARDYSALVLSMLLRSWWRIGVMLLPAVLYGFWGRNPRQGRNLRFRLAAAAAGLYLLGIGAVHLAAGNGGLLGRTFEFDAAVPRLGLPMAMVLDLTGPGKGELVFLTEEQIPETTLPEQTVPEEEKTEPVEYGVNALEADFSALAESAPTSTAAAIHRYVASLTPSSKNSCTGLFAGKNLIFITAEAFSREVIDPELTPTLHRLATRGIRFEEYYQPAWGGSTTTGEFSNLMGIVPTQGGGSMYEVLEQDFFLTLGRQFQALDYTTLAFHNHLSEFYDRHLTHTRLGYDRYIAWGTGMEGKITSVWPESDLEMIDYTLPLYLDQQPFHVYYMTVSGHCLYTRELNAMTDKNWDLVAHLDHSDGVKGYFAANLELEFALESLVRQLEEAGIADDTVIVLASDHYPYGLDRSSTWQTTRNYLQELYAVEEYDRFIRDRNALIIWSGCIEDMGLAVETPVYSLDILPTLSNLFGLEYDSRLLVGRDVFSDAQPLVLWPDHSWVTDLGWFDFGENTFTPRPGAAVEEDYVSRISALVSDRITYSRSVVNGDYFRWLAGQLEAPEE